MSGKPIDEAAATLQRTRCDCHPETCCCGEYTLYLNGERIVSGYRDKLQKVADAVNALAAAQQQGQAVAHPVAWRPSAPVGVEALCQVYYDAYHAGHHDTVEGVYVDVFPVDRDTYWQEKVEEDYADALAQQPAAVDGAKVSAAFSRLERNAYGDPRTAAANRSRDIRTIREALAAQHQEPKS